jgi:hypothetical protein
MARNDRMIWIIVLVLVVLWLGGFWGGVGNIVHVLLVIALVLVIWRLATGRRVL